MLFVINSFDETLEIIQYKTSNIINKEAEVRKVKCFG